MQREINEKRQELMAKEVALRYEIEFPYTPAFFSRFLCRNLESRITAQDSTTSY